jgi:hypothetical protein
MKTQELDPKYRKKELKEEEDRRTLYVFIDNFTGLPFTKVMRSVINWDAAKEMKRNLLEAQVQQWVWVARGRANARQMMLDAGRVLSTYKIAKLSDLDSETLKSLSISNVDEGQLYLMCPERRYEDEDDESVEE